VRTFTPVDRKKLHTIYQHLGSFERLEEIVLRFYDRMKDDVLVGFFFDGKDIRKVAHMQSRFLASAMGGLSAFDPYEGKNPGAAHDQLAPILSGHFDRRLQILEEVLRSEGLPDEDVRTWISFENAFRDVIVKRD
jgi:truncated hemoglobin YjbI